jgi:hypothetical protein
MDQDNVVSRATSALAQSVGSILDDAVLDAEQRKALAETFDQFQTYLLDRTGSKDDDGVGKIDHHASTVADLLTEAGTFPHRTAALHYLLNKPGGQALLARLHKAAEQTEKDDPPMDSILQIMKSGGIGPTCAAIIQKGATTISEHALVDAATAVAAERHPELSPAQAFSKVFTAATDEARVLRQAIDMAKAMPFVADLTPVMVGGAAAGDLSDESEAIAQLQQIGRDRWPTATEAQQFARAMTDPKNAVLTAKAHRRPSATTSYPFPR